MFGKLTEYWKTKRAVKDLEQHPIYGLVLKLLRHTLSDTSDGLGKYHSEDGKPKLMQKVLADIEQVLAQPNPVQAVRMRTIEFMLMAAKFDVLVMQPPTPFKYLSGELKPKIPELAKLDKELEEFFYGIDPTPISFDNMWDAVLMRYWAMHLYMSCYNIVRIALNDRHTNNQKDWFKVAYVSFCIWQENIYRSLLEMPSLIEGNMADMKGIMFLTWMNRAEEGHQELRLVWEKSWEECFGEPSPFSGFPL